MGMQRLRHSHGAHQRRGEDTHSPRSKASVCRHSYHARDVALFGLLLLFDFFFDPLL